MNSPGYTGSVKNTKYARPLTLSKCAIIAPRGRMSEKQRTNYFHGVIYLKTRKTHQTFMVLEKTRHGKAFWKTLASKMLVNYGFNLKLPAYIRELSCKFYKFSLNRPTGPIQS